MKRLEFFFLIPHFSSIKKRVNHFVLLVSSVRILLLCKENRNKTPKIQNPNTTQNVHSGYKIKKGSFLVSVFLSFLLEFESFQEIRTNSQIGSQVSPLNK